MLIDLGRWLIARFSSHQRMLFPVLLRNSFKAGPRANPGLSMLTHVPAESFTVL